MLRNCLESSKIPIRKKWGQNFLNDNNIIRKIIKTVKPDKMDTIVEIGPGKGALTKILSQNASKVLAIEIDPLLFNYLENLKIENLYLYNCDILKWKLDNQAKGNIKIVGNLPYYLSSPIIFKFLNEQYWDEMTIMIQKEVAQRIISKPGSKNYSRISVMCQTFCSVNYQFDVSKNVFYPKPKVNSAVLRFKNKKNTLSINKYSDFIKLAFMKRRKTLANNLKDNYDLSSINTLNNKRAEDFSVKEFLELYNKICI